MALNLHTETLLTGETAQARTTLPPEEVAPHFPQLEILECLGRGGMGVVYKARQKALNRLVALKLVAPERVQDTRFKERFQREALALAALNHPSIVTIYDFGAAGGYYFLLMEYVDGVNLRRVLHDKQFTPEEALTIVPALCDALQYAHDRGIVHRDIKPENVLLDRSGRVKIADFGIARMLGDGVGNPETSGAGNADDSTRGIVGTPGYSAPEQMSGSLRVDHRVDIYSLGVMFYEMLTGELPGQPMVAPSRKVTVDVRLDAVVLRALESAPELRYQQVSEVRTLLETIAAPAGNGANETKDSSPKAGSKEPKRVEENGTAAQSQDTEVSASWLAKCHWTTKLVFVTALYIAAIAAEGATEHEGRGAHLVQLSASMALSTLCVLGRQWWPVVAIGGCFLAARLDENIPFVLITGLANALAAHAGAWFLERFLGFRLSMQRLRDVVSLVAVSVLVVGSIDAGIQTCRAFWNGLPGYEVPVALQAWWLTNFSALMICSPLIMAVANFEARNWRPAQVLEAIFCLLGVVVSTATSFNSWYAYGIQNYPFAFLPYPFLAWAALRFRLLGATLALWILAAFCINALSEGRGPFVTTTNDMDSLLLIHTYLVILSTFVLSLAAGVEEVRALLPPHALAKMLGAKNGKELGR